MTRENADFVTPGSAGAVGTDYIDETPEKLRRYVSRSTCWEFMNTPERHYISSILILRKARQNGELGALQRIIAERDQKNGKFGRD